MRTDLKTLSYDKGQKGKRNKPIQVIRKARLKYLLGEWENAIKIVFFQMRPRKHNRSIRLGRWYGFFLVKILVPWMEVNPWLTKEVPQEKGLEASYWLHFPPKKALGTLTYLRRECSERQGMTLNEKMLPHTRFMHSLHAVSLHLHD